MGRLRNAWDWLTGPPGTDVERSFVWPYPSDDLAVGGYFAYARTAGVPGEEPPAFGFPQLVDQAFRANPIVFACEVKRISIFSEARFLYRTFNKGRPGKLWSDQSLDILESPWPRGTTSDLLAEIGIMADMGGNGFVYRDG